LLDAQLSGSYTISQVGLEGLRPADLDACIAILLAGGAVNVVSARSELPKAATLAIARYEHSQGPIVGLGAIKRRRPQYALKQSENSGIIFDPSSLELGYIAVDPKHRQKGLAGNLLSDLVSRYNGPLWATTDAVWMKKALAREGFVQRGREWQGSRGVLSLWLRD